MSDDPWPTPAALEGVKSRKKAIFKVSAAEVADIHGETRHVSGVELTFESRIAAVGDGGASVAALLCGELAPSSGSAAPHAKLAVAHLGPHLAGADASAQQHASAIAAALKGGPHVVVLDEELSSGGEAWAHTFRQILRGGSISGFKGAVVVRVAMETFAVRRVCTQRWAAAPGRVVQEAIDGSLQIIEDAKSLLSKSATVLSKKQGRQAQQAAADNEALLESVRALADFQFEEDVFAKTEREGYTIALLTKVSSEGTRSFCGFVCYRLRPAPQSDLYISHLAVTKTLRGRGYGKHLMDWIISEAAHMPQSMCSAITASALDKVVPFYEKFGFVAHAVHPEHTDGEDDDDPQTWVELRNVSLVSAQA